MKEYDEQRLRRALERRIGRRDLLQNGAAMALIAGLAGCGAGNASSGSKEETEKPIAKKVDGELLYFNFSEYVVVSIGPASRALTMPRAIRRENRSSPNS